MNRLVVMPFLRQPHVAHCRYLSRKIERHNSRIVFDFVGLWKVEQPLSGKRNQASMQSRDPEFSRFLIISR